MRIALQLKQSQLTCIRSASCIFQPTIFSRRRLYSASDRTLSGFMSAGGFGTDCAIQCCPKTCCRRGWRLATMSRADMSMLRSRPPCIAQATSSACSDSHLCDTASKHSNSQSFESASFQHPAPVRKHRESRGVHCPASVPSRMTASALQASTMIRRSTALGSLPPRSQSCLRRQQASLGRHPRRPPP